MVWLTKFLMRQSLTLRFFEVSLCCNEENGSTAVSFLKVFPNYIANEMAEYARKSGIEISVSVDDDLKVNAD